MIKRHRRVIVFLFKWTPIFNASVSASLSGHKTRSVTSKKRSLHGGGVGAVVRSLPFSLKFPGSNPRLCREWNICQLSFPLKFTQLSILPRLVKWVPACMNCFEAAAICACVCFQSAGGKLIIVKRLWDVCDKGAIYMHHLTFLLHAQL